MATTTPTVTQKGKLQKPGPSSDLSNGVEWAPPAGSSHDDGVVKVSGLTLILPIVGC